MKMNKRKTAAYFATVCLLAVVLLSQALAENTIDITTNEDVLSIQADSTPLLLYRYNNVPFKPYIQKLFSPSGVNILRDAPFDHLHHHALMYAVKVDGVNFWEETPTAGKQIHKSFSNITSKVETNTQNDKQHQVHHAAFTELIDWNDSSGKLLLKEKRTIEVHLAADLDATLLTWQSEFELPEGTESATLTGAHYHGLGLRFIRSMDATGEFRNADGKAGTVFRGDERLVRSRWCAYTAKAEGKEVTVAMFDDPDNERHPATWFTMSKPFAYLSATLNLHEPAVGGLKVVSGEPLVLRYAVAIWDGRAKTDDIEKLYKRSIALPPETTATPNPDKRK